MEVSGREVTTDLALANITTDNTNDNSNNDNGSVNERTPLATTVELNDAGFDFATIPASSDLADVSPTESSDDHQSLATLDTLPPELLEHVLYLVPPRQRQRAALSLARAVAGFEPSVKQLWTHMAVTRAAQIWPLWRKLKVEKRGAAAMRTFAMVRICCQQVESLAGEQTSGDQPNTTRCRTPCHAGPSASSAHMTLLVDRADRQESWRGDADILNKYVPTTYGHYWMWDSLRVSLWHSTPRTGTVPASSRNRRSPAARR